MRYSIVFISIIGLVNNALAQTPKFDWAIQTEGSLFEQNFAQATFNNHIYVAGNFSDTVDFDPDTSKTVLVSVGSTNAYIKKLTDQGKLLWVKQFTSSFQTRSTKVKTDLKGNLYLLLQYKNDIDADPDTGTQVISGFGSCLVKLNPNGSLLWATRVMYAFEFDVDVYGNVYVTKSSGGILGFDPTISAKGQVDTYIQKINNNGQYAWIKQVSGDKLVTHPKITIDNTGNIILTGDFSGTCNFSPSGTPQQLTAKNQLEKYFLKLDSSASLIWAKSNENLSSQVQCQEIISGSNNEIYLVGEYLGKYDFAPGTDTFFVSSSTRQGPVFERNTYIQKLTQNGNLNWVKTFVGFNYPYEINEARDKSLQVVGSFESPSAFNPKDTSKKLAPGSIEYFISKLDSAGNYQWAGQLNLTNNGHLHLPLSINTDTNNNIYIAGTFNSITGVDFDPHAPKHLKTSKNSDAFVLKLHQCQNTTQTDLITTCKPFTWLNGKTYHQSNVGDSVIFKSQGGCDSIIKLHLSYQQNIKTIDSVTACNQYTWIDGNTYTNSNLTAQHTLTSQYGCDSIVSLKLLVKKVSIKTLVINGSKLKSNNPNATYQWLDCNNNFAPISGANKQDFRPEQNGRYAVQLSENGCVDTSQCVDVVGSGFADLKIENGFKVYPNPNSGRFIIEAPNNEETTVELLDIRGELIEQAVLKNTLTEISLKAKPGTYILRYKNQKGVGQNRIVIK